MDLVFAYSRVFQTLLNWRHTLLEVMHAEFFKLGSGDGNVEVNGFGKGIDLDVGLGR